MDGVVIDSEKLHLRALGLTLEQNCIAFPEEILNDFVGRSDRSFFVHAKENLDERVHIEEYIRHKEAIFDEISAELQFIDGFPDFIETVKARQIKTALVTSSPHHLVKKADEKLNFIHFFDVIIAEEDTAKHKPNPEPYLLAFKKTQAEESTTIVIEDSLNGIIAGKAAGCTVFGLGTSFATNVLINAGADAAFDTYKELKEAFFV